MRSKRFRTLRLMTRPETPWRLLCWDMVLKSDGCDLLKGRRVNGRLRP